MANVTATLELTAHGESRLRALSALAVLDMREALQESVETILRPLASELAPTHLEEATLISTSVEGVGVPYPLEAGPDRIRFMKQAHQRYVRDAILEDPVETVIASDQVITASTGHIAKLNQLTQFSWRRASFHHGKSIAGEIQESNWTNLIVMWEEGGQPFMVKPRRSGRRALLPEDASPGFLPDFRFSLTKQIPPFQMYRTAWLEGREPVMAKLQLVLARVAREAGNWNTAIS